MQLSQTQETRTPMQRADELLAQMTVEEKALQLSSIMPVGVSVQNGSLGPTLQSMLSGGIGHVASVPMIGNKSAGDLARTTNGIQRYLREETRLGIPAIFHNEALNGFVAPSYTVFPTAIGLAATWNPGGVEEMAHVISHQMRSVGVRQALSPVMDVARDARWGRVHETYGEDPYLVSAMGVAFTRGLQSADLTNGVIATAKHFLGYGMTEGGQNMAATTVHGRELYEVYARPFEAAIKLAGLGSVMNSYSEYDGIPIGASRAILTDLLRGKLGFTGTVVSDYNTVNWLQGRQSVAENAEQAGILAICAGLDVELPTVVGYGAVLAAAVTAGKVPEAVLDNSVRLVLRDKFALGLFDDPYVPEDPIDLDHLAQEGTELALGLARQSVTLLKNDDNLLPLPLDLRKIAIIGPHGDDADLAFPAYTYPGILHMMRGTMGGGGSQMAGVEMTDDSIPPEAIAVLGAELGPIIMKDARALVRDMYGAESLAETVRRLCPTSEVAVVRGCGVKDDEPADMAAAVEAATNADMVILALGGRGGWFADTLTEGEGSDTANIDLPACQVELVRAVAATGTPLVGVVNTGRPFALTSVIDQLPAVLYGYYGGQHAARAMGDVLFGIVNPSGKLPYTLPRHVGQVPIYQGEKIGSGYRRSSTDLHHGYLDMPSTPLFPFGHGLSYTSYEYADLALSASDVDIDQSLVISLRVTNVGARGGDEVVQLYFSDTASGVTRPAQELVGFARVGLESGQSALLTFEVQVDQLGYVGAGGDFLIEPGPIDVLVGSSSDDIRLRSRFDITGESPKSLAGKRSYLSKSSVAAL